MGELIIPQLLDLAGGGTLDLRSLRSKFGLLRIKGIQNFSVLQSGADIPEELLVPGLNWKKFPLLPALNWENSQSCARVKLKKKSSFMPGLNWENYQFYQKVKLRKFPVLCQG